MKIHSWYARLRTQIVLLTLLVLPVKAIDVFVDFNGDYYANLWTASFNAGVTPFSTTEAFLEIRPAIVSQLEYIYQDYDINFVTVKNLTYPGGAHSEVLDFGVSEIGLGVLGGTSFADYRNTEGSPGNPDIAEIYTSQFSMSINEFSGSTDRALQISQISTALANVAAHELGHNLGLHHFDVYGYASVNSQDGTYTNTGGVQANSILANGASGSTEALRDSLVREINPVMAAKLELADGVNVGGPIASQLEIGGSTMATPQEVVFTDLATTDGQVANVIGFIDVDDVTYSTTEPDYYSFTATAGEAITAHALAEGIDSDMNLSSVVEIYDSDGNLLFSNDQVRTTGNSWGSGTLRSMDGYILNYVLPEDDTYTMVVRGDKYYPAGNYELFLMKTPEPSSVLLSVIGFCCLLLRRTRK